MSIKFYTSPNILYPPKQISGYAPGQKHRTENLQIVIARPWFDIYFGLFIRFGIQKDIVILA